MSAALAEPPTEEQPIEPAAAVPEALAQFNELAAAIRRHQAVAGHPAIPRRPLDHALYRMLDELER